MACHFFVVSGLDDRRKYSIPSAMRMKKFINRPENIVRELLEGLALAHPRQIQLVGSNLIARAKPKTAGMVGVVTLGGSGHEPGLSGFVGEGMLDVSVAGEIFAAPGPPRCLEALRLADRGAGVILVVLNHAGDVLSSNITLEMAASHGLNVRRILTHEDIAGGPNPEDRRGLVGFLPVYKVTGAAAEQGLPLERCLELAERMERNTRTLSVALCTATHPATGRPMFNLGDDEMEVGMGQHGEAGTGRMKLKTADETADLMLPMLLNDLQVKQGEDLLVVVNGAGATTLMELFILFRRVHQILAEKKINLARAKVGEFITTQEQAGFQLMISRMDPELIAFWDAPCDAPYFTVR
jgi:phosphoenolpyruvate---glycerone phosphotransferase subunit DhaK